MSGRTSAVEPPRSDLGRIPASVASLLPVELVFEHDVVPIAWDGETVTVAAVDPGDIALADRLRFLLGKNVELVGATAEAISKARILAYAAGRRGRTGVSGIARSSALVDEDDRSGRFDSSAVDFSAVESAMRSMTFGRGGGKRSRQAPPVEDTRRSTAETAQEGIGGSMFFYTVDEGHRVLVRRGNGKTQIVDGPRRIWCWGARLSEMKRHVAHPGEYLVVRYRDGGQQHVVGPCDVWFDPREHLEVETEKALQIGANEAVVVYTREEGCEGISRRVVYGPTVFVPEPGQWLHTFSWHAARGGAKGVRKVPNALVFQKIWLLPDQMYHDVEDVRTADDAVLTLRLMVFFELIDLERMLETTHDPIGDFVNAATSDVVEFTGKHDFESFKQNTDKLNDIATYKQLTGRAEQCGYRINKVVYRGYGAADSLQQMHDQAIEARTRLQLDRATEQQAQDLEDYKLECQLARASKRRGEQTSEVEHDLEIAGKRQRADLERQQEVSEFQRDARKMEADLALRIRADQEEQRRAQLSSLRDLGVDLTAYLTQARADRVIELRGANGTHVHLDEGSLGENGTESEKSASVLS